MAYFSNSTDGSVLDEQCFDCPLGSGWNDPHQGRLFEPDVDYQPPELRFCPTAFVQLSCNYDQVGNKKLTDAMEILVDKNGVCQTRKALKEIRDVVEPKR